MNNYFLNMLYADKRQHSALYKRLQHQYFGKELTWNQMKEQSEDVLRSFAIQFRNELKLELSPIDPKKLTQAILNSRSGMGGAAVTPYVCKLCEKDDVWSNTATPGICRNCAHQMALNIAKYHFYILKDEYMNQLKNF